MGKDRLKMGKKCLAECITHEGRRQNNKLLHGVYVVLQVLHQTHINKVGKKLEKRKTYPAM